MARVQLVGVSKRYGQTTAVQALDLDIAHGEFLTLLGASGCGKSTTLQLAARGFDVAINYSRSKDDALSRGFDSTSISATSSSSRPWALRIR